jgi:phosphopantothenoylcysteine decarboxylase/phosphopantothenate--cysteine ligase
MDFKKILFIIGGGISAYKSLDLIRNLINYNFKITPVITKSGLNFITPLSVATLSQNEVYTDLFDYKKRK